MKVKTNPNTAPTQSGPQLETTKVPKGTLKYIKEYCKGCGYCVEFCPKKVLAMSAEYNRKGYHFPAIKNPDACIACGLCGQLCPDFAIYFLPDKKPKE